MISSEEDDYWLTLRDVRSTNEHSRPPLSLQVETLAELEPLDAQFGTLPKVCVPDNVMTRLFGDGSDPSLKTYAIIDAAIIHGLVEILASSGLEYRCLFQGPTAEQLGDAAPYLVALQHDHELTRRLFTRSGQPADLWERKAGIFLRSPAAFDELWRHFRKFTRVQDVAGHWLYFRFWEQATLPAYLEAISRDHLKCRRFFGQLVTSFLIPAPDEGLLHIIHAPKMDHLKPAHGAFVVTVDLHRFCSGVLLILGGELFEGHG
ncbi:hypothetical protein BFP70_14525 [Thioclava sp. SK-1]|uniref:DUF4123 domain-containing protein n=1 Tax=Thioclava sp. SK-1 TaxID=1889770 RepID=UPI000824890C|nr:DUF4123 domain-containing protein [Thioclava sp. SK-1]OCX62069.1 hypothetical protein BFP70_14525 [Thioclava sp. SK-1]